MFVDVRANYHHGASACCKLAHRKPLNTLRPIKQLLQFVIAQKYCLFSGSCKSSPLRPPLSPNCARWPFKPQSPPAAWKECNPWQSSRGLALGSCPPHCYCRGALLFDFFFPVLRSSSSFFFAAEAFAFDPTCRCVIIRFWPALAEILAHRKPPNTLRPIKQLIVIAQNVLLVLRILIPPFVPRPCFALPRWPFQAPQSPPAAWKECTPWQILLWPCALPFVVAMHRPQSLSPIPILPRIRRPPEVWQ